MTHRWLIVTSDCPITKREEFVRDKNCFKSNFDKKWDFENEVKMEKPKDTGDRFGSQFVRCAREVLSGTDF